MEQHEGKNLPTLNRAGFHQAPLSSPSLDKTGTEEVSIFVSENEVPPSVGKVLDELYGSLFSSLAHLQVHESLNNANTYVAAKGMHIAAALIFRQEQHEVTVLNEVFRIDQEEVARFVRYIFSRYPFVKKIAFSAIACELGDIGYALQRLPGTEYIIVSLPRTEEEYTASLGKATRKNIRHHLSRLKRTFPSFVHEVQEAGDISEEDLLSIIEFNRLRMADKQKIVHLSQEDVARIVKLAKRCGFISLIRIDGRVCGGAICYRTGKTVTSHVNAHDPQYNQYRLGTLSCYLAVCESIRRGAKEFNLEWGAEDYKYALLGVDHPFDHALIYRSYRHMLADSKAILQIRTNNRVRAVRIWLVDQSKKNGYFARYLNSCIGMVKRRKYLRAMEGRK
jgi:hypothetical protein